MLHVMQKSQKPTGPARLRRLVWTVTLAATLTAVCGLLADAAQAASLKAKLYLTTEKVPNGLPEKELLAFARKNQTSRIEETGEGAIQERFWKVYAIVAFNAPPGKLEYEMVFYDIQQGKRIEVERQSVLLSDPNQKNYVQRVVLKRPKYQPNSNMELVIAIRGAEVGRLKFKLVGAQSAGASASSPAKK